MQPKQHESDLTTHHKLVVWDVVIVCDVVLSDLVPDDVSIMGRASASIEHVRSEEPSRENTPTVVLRRAKFHEGIERSIMVLSPKLRVDGPVCIY